MNVASESAEQMTKMMLDGTEVTLRITGQASKELIVLLYTILKENNKTKGQVRLTNMLKSGKPLEVFSIRNDQLKTFMNEAKRYGVLYTALVDKNKTDKDGLVDILVRQEDAAKINRIVERFKLFSTNTAKIKTEIEKDLNQVPLVKEPQSEKQSNKSKLPEENRKSVREELNNIKQEIASSKSNEIMNRTIDKTVKDMSK